MNKIGIILSSLIILTNITYSNEEYENWSSWSTEKTGYADEKEQVFYGYKVPVEWSEWSDVDIHDPYTKSELRAVPDKIPDKKNRWSKNQAQLLYKWPSDKDTFSEPQRLLAWGIDIDSYDRTDWTHYYEPKMRLTCTLTTGEEKTVASTPGRTDMNKNMFGKGDYWCTKVELKMVESVPYTGRKEGFEIGTVYSYVSFEKNVYSHVTKWSEGIGWREDEEYEDIKGPEVFQKPTEETFYTHPAEYKIIYKPDDIQLSPEYPQSYNPDVGISKIIPNKEDGSPDIPHKYGYEFNGFYLTEDYSGDEVKSIPAGTSGNIVLYAKFDRIPPTIDVEQRYLYEDDTIETIEDLAIATDLIDGDISDKIVITDITYDDTGESDDYPVYFDPYVSDTIHVTYLIEGTDISKTVKLYILRKGVFTNLKIYDRYISKEYLYTLEPNSIWKNDDYNKSLIDAFEWLERK